MASVLKLLEHIKILRSGEMSEIFCIHIFPDGFLMADQTLRPPTRIATHLSRLYSDTGNSNTLISPEIYFFTVWAYASDAS